MQVKVVLDTNFLMLIPTFRGDIFKKLDEVLGRKTEKIVLSPIFDELKNISLGRDLKAKKQANIVLKLLGEYNLKLVDVKYNPLKTVDELIVETAKTWNCLVATNDKELKRKLTALGVPIVYPRQRSRLEVRGLNF